ncbi:hypothetical protein RND81_08G103300 [Saponaria officinalis]|uniref:DUF569 domain-containing protein n=1 Tax=Saponaria officinalis TaxID=3572 RepID=A0AAW1J8Z8_SAPOF
MEFFARAKAVRLRSQHNKFLVAADDEESVKQSRNGSSKNSRWCVEPVENKPNLIRLKNSQSWKYLRATEDPYLLGMTGRRVGQSSPRLRLDPTVEWEPIKEGSHVKLRTRKGNFLRANGGIPPWNNSVTHDVPSRSSTQDWVLWTVDVLEVADYESTDEIKGSNVEDYNKGFLSKNSSTNSTISKLDFYKDCHDDVGSEIPSDDHHQVKKNNEEYDVESNCNTEDEYRGCLSRNASKGSTVSKKESYKECIEKELSTQSSKASSQASEKPTRVSAVGHHVRDEPKHSDSFNKLKSALDGLDDLLDDSDGHDTESEAEAEPVVEPTLHKPHLLEVKMAKHTLKELKDLDYETVLSLGKEKKLAEAVNVLIADVTMSGSGQVPRELETLGDRLKSMRQDHDSATQDIEEYTTFSIRRLEMKGELKKDATKAHELEAVEVGLSNTLMNARAKRVELLKQLEEVENTIKDTEKAQADNALEIDEIVSRIGEKSESLREMERKEKSWQVRKVEAERKLESVEEGWAKMQCLFEDV